MRKIGPALLIVVTAATMRERAGRLPSTTRSSRTSARSFSGLDAGRVAHDLLAVRIPRLEGGAGAERAGE